MSQGVPIPGMKVGESLDAFHDRCVEVPSEETRQKKRRINENVTFLQESFSEEEWSVDKVIKSGSLGKGTAVRGRSDIDLMVYFNGPGGMRDFLEERSFFLDDLEDKIDEYWGGQIEFIHRTQYSLSYKLFEEKLDILPAFDVIDSVQGQLPVLYDNMANFRGGASEAGKQYSASLAPLQISFVRREHGVVKRVIRLLKYWKEENDLNIRSYTLELITIFVARSMEDFEMSTDSLFRNVIKRLKNCRYLKVAFNDNYEREDHGWWFKVPYVLDPANPYLDTLAGADLNKISKVAWRTLQTL